VILAAELWFDFTIDTWPLVMATLVGTGCGLLGSVFLLRRAALLGDAVSHSVLPGIAIGLLVHGLLGGASEEVFGWSSTMLFVLSGALLAGLSCVLLVEALHRHSRIKPDTALGAVFPAFFALGVILLEQFASGSHIDANCVFYGSLELVDSGRQVLPTLAVTAIAVFFTFLARKELEITSFDPGMARALGLPVRLINTALVVLLTAMVVCAFEAVGAILVIAFLIIPPATAFLLCDRFQRMLCLAAASGVIAGLIGCWLTIALGSAGFETARAPTIAVVAGIEFVSAFLFAPRRGVFAQLWKRRALARRILDENLLGALYRLSSGKRTGGGETQPVAAPSVPVPIARAADSLSYSLAQLRPALARTRRRGEILEHDDGTVSLTMRGRAQIERVLRAHRLWEIYMTNEMGTAPDHVHDAADSMEHFLQPALVEDLDRLLRHPSRDPHGTEIPGP
jgi:ABC-type Mn2+/Zn2+ transport system permease subunit/Mn-dependent DtxR family transcriptional regulator